MSTNKTTSSEKTQFNNLRDNAQASEKEANESYQVAVGNKGSTFLFNAAESPSLYNGLRTCYGQDACAYKKEKQRHHENHFELGLQVVSLHLWMWFCFVFFITIIT